MFVPSDYDKDQVKAYQKRMGFPVGASKKAKKAKSAKDHYHNKFAVDNVQQARLVSVDHMARVYGEM